MQHSATSVEHSNARGFAVVQMRWHELAKGASKEIDTSVHRGPEPGSFRLATKYAVYESVGTCPILFVLFQLVLGMFLQEGHEISLHTEGTDGGIKTFLGVFH